MLMDFTVTMPVAALKDATVVAEGDDGDVGFQLVQTLEFPWR